MRFVRSALAAVLVVPIVLQAQAPADSLSLAGRSSFMVGLGLTGSKDASATASGAIVRASGEIGSLSFSHWVRSDVAAEISAAVLGAGVSGGFGGFSANASAITPILFGLSYSPRALALGTSLRPFVSAAAGPYIHMASGARGSGADASTEAVPGARLGVGANLFVSRHFMLAVTGDYNAVGRFSHVDAVSEHPSGFGMSLAFGVAWGGR
ncbi:MAG: hypothetical protein ABJF01_19510 [bacterium]